jgi:hypothetical protein
MVGTFSRSRNYSYEGSCSPRQHAHASPAAASICRCVITPPTTRSGTLGLRRELAWAHGRQLDPLEWLLDKLDRLGPIDGSSPGNSVGAVVDDLIALAAHCPQIVEGDLTGARTTPRGNDSAPGKDVELRLRVHLRLSVNRQRRDVVGRRTAPLTGVHSPTTHDAPMCWILRGDGQIPQMGRSVRLASGRRVTWVRSAEPEPLRGPREAAECVRLLTRRRPTVSSRVGRLMAGT